MYVILEYLTYLAVVSFLGLVLFGATVLGMVVKTGASKLADETALKIPQIVSRFSSDEAPDLKKHKPETAIPSS